jgi:hypothetical protein
MYAMGVWLSRGISDFMKMRVAREGKAEDLNDGNIYRSSWERNIARLFAMQKIPVAYEPMRFKFPMRGRENSYLPDWKLRGIDLFVGDQEYTSVFIELKGFYDLKSQKKIRNMAKYYGPRGVMVIVLTEDIYKQIERDWGGIVPGWEHGRLSPYGISAQQLSDSAEDGAGPQT